MAMFGKSAQAAAGYDPSGLTPQDRLMLFGATLGDLGTSLRGGDPTGIINTQAFLGQRQQRAAAEAWKRGLFGAQAQAAMPPGVDASEGGEAPMQPRLPSLRELAPQLLNAPPGVDIRPIVDVLTATRPEGMNVNGRIVDKNDPASIGLEVTDVDKGQMRLYDSKGNFAGIRNADGYVQSVAELEEAKAGASERGKAPYSFQTFTGPDGRPITVTGATAAALGANGGIISRGPTPAEESAAKIVGDAAATSKADLPGKMAGYASQLDALDNMEGFLPDVISGFGSDLRLQAARASAALGDETAKRKVVATETFLNQGRVLVSNIIRTFGANPTEGERKYAERMSGADAELNPGTLAEGIKLQRERIKREMRSAQDQAARASSSGGGRTNLSSVPVSDRMAEARRRGLIP